MSPLTKLLVALHVLLSLMLTAGVVVFVNKVSTVQTEFESQRARTAAAEAAASSAGTLAGIERSAAIQQVEANSRQVQAVQQSLTTSQQRVSEQAGSIADLSSKLAMISADNTRLTEALRASQDAQSKLNTALTELRGESDKLVTERAELNARVSDLTSNLEVTERERRFASEQLSQSKSDVEKLAGELERLGYKPQQLIASAAVVPVRVPAINGVVRDTRNIEGVAYATISVGSSDSVSQGMRFSVIDRDNAQFLGILTVDNVEANEATGRLTGPAVDRIRPGNEVRTQL